MTQYLVIKSVQLLVGRKTYRKDMIMTAEDVGEDKIKRYLAGGYIKPIGEVQDSIFLLTPEEIDKLRKPELLVYAEEIGVENINPKATSADLKNAINAFIEEMEEAETEDDEEDEDNVKRDEPLSEDDDDNSDNDKQQSLENGGEA